MQRPQFSDWSMQVNKGSTPSLQCKQLCRTISVPDLPVHLVEDFFLVSVSQLSLFLCQSCFRSFPSTGVGPKETFYENSFTLAPSQLLDSILPQHKEALAGEQWHSWTLLQNSKSTGREEAGVLLNYLPRLDLKLNPPDLSLTEARITGPGFGAWPKILPIEFSLLVFHQYELQTHWFLTQCIP
jgi:hypothetical protein